MTTTRTQENLMHVAVAFLASDVNRFSVNALTGAIEQDPNPSQLSFPHPRSVSTCQREIEHIVEQVGPSGTVVIAFSFMSSALVTTSRLLRQLQEGLAAVRQRLLFVARGAACIGGRGRNTGHGI